MTVRTARSGAAASAFIVALAASATPAFATAGYFAQGYGVQSEGLGGASIAYPKDSLAIATNPASLFELGDRADLGIDWFRPDRSATISGNGAGSDATYSGNGRTNFFIPQVGYVHTLNDRWAIGIAAYGNGGMNTAYDANPYSRFGASGRAGVNLEQLFVSPT